MMPQQPQNKKSPKVYSNDNILEAIRGLTGGVGKTLTRDVVTQGGSDALNSLFGSLPKRGEMRPNEPIDPSRERQPVPAPFRRPEIARQPVIHIEEQGLKQKIEAIRGELKLLATSVKKLNTEIEKAVADVPVNPGVYHLNFLERLKGVLAVLREQVEDSSSWLALFSARKQKKQYWGLYKKHGTKFGLSSERTIATQAG